MPLNCTTTSLSRKASIKIVFTCISIFIPINRVNDRNNKELRIKL